MFISLFTKLFPSHWSNLGFNSISLFRVVVFSFNFYLSYIFLDSSEFDIVSLWTFNLHFLKEIHQIYFIKRSKCGVSADFFEVFGKQCEIIYNINFLEPMHDFNKHAFISNLLLIFKSRGSLELKLSGQSCHISQHFLKVIQILSLSPCSWKFRFLIKFLLRVCL